MTFLARSPTRSPATSGSAFLGVVVHAAFTYKLGDLWAPLMAGHFDLERHHGSPRHIRLHGSDRVPRRRDHRQDSRTEQNRLLDGYAAGKSRRIRRTCYHRLYPRRGHRLPRGIRRTMALQLGVKMSAVMVLMPKIVKMHHGRPASAVRTGEGSHELQIRRFEFYIGLDPAILLGDSQVVTAGPDLYPDPRCSSRSSYPATECCPSGDLATIGFFIAIAVAVCKGNLFRTLISGIAIMWSTIWIANGNSVGRKACSDHRLYHRQQSCRRDGQGGSPITYIFTQLFTMQNVPGLLVVGIGYAICMVFAVRCSEAARCGAGSETGTGRRILSL